MKSIILNILVAITRICLNLIRHFGLTPVTHESIVYKTDCDYNFYESRVNEIANNTKLSETERNFQIKKIWTDYIHNKSLVISV